MHRCTFLFLLLVAGYPAVCHAREESAAVTPLVGAWVQYTANGMEVRVVSTDTCPELELDGKAVAMTTRAAPSATHPDRVCSAELPLSTRSILLDSRPLPAPDTGIPERIVIIGDTGCRVSAEHGLYQACNNSSLWPFARVAASAARTAPDLIIHMGDYLYRESPCPDGNRGCAGTPWGDTQAAWKADFFQPARPLLATAPLLFIRGNHETCARAGTGWFRYLGPRPFKGECLQSSRSWMVKAGALQLAVLDSAEVRNAHGQSLAGSFARQLEQLKELIDGAGWILTHRPFWAFGSGDDSGKPIEPTAALQSAVRQTGLPAGISLVIGGHLHLAGMVGFDGPRPPQLVVGNGGTQLVPESRPPDRIDGMSLLNPRAYYQYGFVTLEREPSGNSTITFRDRRGGGIAACRLTANHATCPPAPQDESQPDALHESVPDSGAAADVPGPLIKHQSLTLLSLPR